jgi:integrase
MLEMLLGNEGKRKLRLHQKPNSELFSLYDSQLILKHRSPEALQEARRVLGHFRTHLGEFSPSPELAAGFLAQFQDHKPTTLYRYDSILKGFMLWYGEKLETRIRVPETLPEYIEDDDIEKLKAAMRSKKTHKKVIERNLLIIDMITKTGLRRAEIADLKVGDINLAQRYLTVRMGKGMKDRIVELTPLLTLALEGYLKNRRPEESVFGLKATTISGLIHWAALKAGVDIHCHSLRHFFGERLVDTGTDLEIVRRLMGHANLTTTQRYIGRTDQQRRAAVERLENPRAGEKISFFNQIPMVSRIRAEPASGRNVDPVLVDQVTRHVNIMSGVARTISDIREFIQSYGEGEAFIVTESPEFPATFRFQPLPRNLPVLGSFLNGQVALDFPEVLYFFQHLAAEFPDLPLKEWRELVTRRTLLPLDLSKRICSLAHNARFTYCPSCQVCQDLVTD